ncbi:FAST kinase domain-containing protein 3, mitochondrial-like [Engraulis encrasicolus]|uniref:FAST kinase domain-containing protein 3, mitochondrial-like n=1 Tax=Engraulis encrasicolus TaxID=184585 RepID=UPI002FD72725
MNSVVLISSVRTVGQFGSHKVCRRLMRVGDPNALGRTRTQLAPCNRTQQQRCSLHLSHGGRGASALQLSNMLEERDLNVINQIQRYHIQSHALPSSEVRTLSLSAPDRGLAAPAAQASRSFPEAEMWNMVRDTPNGVSVSGLATLMGVCVKLGMSPDSPAGLVSKLKNECLRKLHEEDVDVTNLCLLGEVVYSLEGPSSELFKEALKSIGASIDGDLTPLEASNLYAFFSLIGNRHIYPDPVTKLHRCAERLTHTLPPTAVTNILSSLSVLREGQPVVLIQKLIQRASLTMASYSDSELTGVLQSLTRLSQHSTAFLRALEQELLGRMEACDPELIGAAMEHCLHARWRSAAVFEAVAERFVQSADAYSTPQIAKQMVALGRLSYLPHCASQMFGKLESVLSSRFAQFQPRALLNLLHACIHLERFPINFVSKVFSPYFLQRLAEQNNGLDRTSLAQLTQLNMCTSLECTHYQGPKLPFHYHVKNFSSVHHFIESPLEGFLFKMVYYPLCKVLGGRNYFTTNVYTKSGYTVDVELNVDEEGMILHLSQWEQAYRRIALCLDGPDRFCTNTHHLLGQEVTKQRHLRKLGYEVIQIPYFEFEELKTRRERQQYLHKKISHSVSRICW